jgi:hypothetical protein
LQDVYIDDIKFFTGFSGEEEITSMVQSFVRSRFTVINDSDAMQSLMIIVKLQNSTGTMLDVSVIEKSMVPVEF